MDPPPIIPEPTGKGRKARRLVSGQKSLSVEEFVKSCSTKDWRIYDGRETTRGSVKFRVLRKSVSVWDKQNEREIALRNKIPAARVLRRPVLIMSFGDGHG